MELDSLLFLAENRHSCLITQIVVRYLKKNIIQVKVTFGFLFFRELFPFLFKLPLRFIIKRLRISTCGLKTNKAKEDYQGHTFQLDVGYANITAGLY